MGELSGRDDVLIPVLVGLVVLVVVDALGRLDLVHALRDRIAPTATNDRQQLARERRPMAARARAAGATVFGVTESVVRGLGPWQRLEALLERADVPLRAVELAYLMLATGGVGGFLALAVGFGGIAAILAAGLGAAAPYAAVRRRATARRAAFDDQLPDLLMALSASMKAGHTFLTGLAAVGLDGAEPARSEVRRVLQETSLGRPIEDALAAAAGRIGSDNFTFVVRTVVIQRDVGGSLAGIFDMVADTVRDRQQFARRVRAATAMGRMSASVLMALPLALGALLTAMNPSYMSPLYETSAGRTLLAVAIVMMAMGALVLRRIVAVRA